MDITLLGTGSPIPDPSRAGPSTLVRSAGCTLLVDCGRGVLMRLVAAGVLPPMLSAVLVTHLHSDHLTDLNDVITTHWVMSNELESLTVFGPPGMREVVDATLAALGPDIGYRLAHHEDLTWRPMVDVTEVAPGARFDVGSAAVRVAATDHRPVKPTVGYRVEDDGRAVVLGGDGVPCPGLDELCAGADAYVQTVIRDDLVRLVPIARFQDIIDYHSNRRGRRPHRCSRRRAQARPDALRPGHGAGPARRMAGPRRSPFRRRHRAGRRPHDRRAVRGLDGSCRMR
jgi:ribonuclease Z